MRDEVKKNHKNEKSFLGSILAFLDFRKFFKNPLFIYGAIIFVIIAGLIFIFASLFLPARTIDESLIIKNIKIKQVATIIIGQPIKWTVLVKRSDINSGQYLVKLPKKADNIKISLIKGEQAEKILSAGLEKTPFSDRQKQSALNDKKGNLLFRFANFLFADLEQAASDAVQNALEAITQPENPDIIKTSDSTIVDLSQQAMSEAEQPAASINSGQAKQEEKKAEKEQAKEQEEQQVAPATPDSPVIPASAGIQGEGADTNTNLDSPVPLSVENSDVAKQGNNNTSPAPEETPAEYVQISYETPSPEIIEQETNTGKLVTISSSDTGIINCETLNPRTAGGATSNDGATSLLQSAGASISGAFLNILSAIKKYLFADLEQAVNEIINFQLPIFNELSNDSISKDTETPTTEIIVPTLEEPAETPAPVEEQLVIEAPAETPTEITMPVEETPAPAETPEPVEVRLPQVESVTAADAAYQECLAQQVPLTDVLAFTNIPEIYKVGQEDKIKIKWKSNGNQNMDFHAYDLNNNGKLDYVEWIVPHLSDQVFDIIYISKAFRLDENKQIAEDIYDTVATQDNQWATVQSNEWLRFTFESLVDSTKNIDIYAKPTSEVGLAYLEVYRENGDQVIATLYIDHEDYYHVSTANLGDNPTDVFDFKIIGGVDIDYVQDAACTAGKSGNWNDSTVWTCAKIPDSSDTVTISNASYTVTVTADAAASTLSISAGTLNIQTFAVAVTGAVQITGTGTISGSTGVLTGGSYDVQSGTISAILGGTGIALTKTTSGTVVLSGANTFTGGVTLSAGTLDLRAATALGTGTLTINGGSFKKSTFGTLTLTTNNVQAWNGDFSIADSSYTIDFGTGAITLSANRAITVNSGNMIFGGAIGDGGNAYTITLTGAGSIAFTGANTYDGLTTVSSGGLILSGDNSAASGGVTLTAGTLDLRSATALGTGTLTITGGSLKKATIGVLTLTTNNPMSWNGDFSMAASSYGIDFGTGAITLGGNRTITASSSGFIFGGAIGDGGNAYTLTKAGSSDLTLSGANTYTGLTTISAGTLTLSGDNTAASGGVTLTAGTLNVNSATALGTGTLTINGGTISNTSGGSITNTKNNAQAWNSDFTFSISTWAVALNLGTGAVTLGGNIQVTTATGSGSNVFTIGGAIGDGGNGYTLTKAGHRNLILNGANTYTGLTTVSAGVLTLAGDNSAASGGVTLNSGATLNINSATALGTGTFTINGGTISNTSGGTITNTENNIQAWNGDFTLYQGTALNLGTGAVTLSGNRQVTTSSFYSTLTIGGAIGDNGNSYTLTFTTVGYGGVVVLSGNNTYTGLTTVTPVSTFSLTLSGDNTAASGGVTLNAGGLYINSATALGTGTLTINGGGIGSSNSTTITTNNIQNWNGNFTCSNSTVGLGTGAVTLGGNIQITMVWGTLTVGGAIGDSGSGYTLTLAGNNSTLILSGANTYTGATTITGTTSTNFLRLSNALAAQYSTVTVSVANGLKFGTSIGTFTIGGLSGASNFVLADTGSTAITLQAGGNNANTTYSGIMSGTSGALTKQGSGTLILSGVNTYTGDTIISAGTLQNGVADSFKSATTTISSGATLDLSTFNLTLAGSTSFANNGTLKLYGDQTVTNAPTNGVGSTVEYNATAGSRAIKSWTYTNAILKINGTGGTFTLPADPACTGITLAAGTLAGSTQAITTGGFTMSGGTFTGSGAMAVNGNLTYSSGTNSHTGAWTQGTGNLGWNTGATYIQNYQAASGAIITLSTRAVAKSITVPTDATVNLGSNYFQSWNASNDQLSLQGTWSATTGYVLVSAFSSRSNSNPIQVGTVELRMQSSDDVWTQSGSIQCGTLRILGDSGTNKATLTLAGNMNAGAVVIGHTIGVAIYSTSGVLNLGSGTHTIASIVQGNAANLNDAIDFGTSNTSITGSANFTGIAVSNTSATVNFTGTTGTPTLTTAGATMPNMVVNNNGVTSFTVADTPLTTGSFTLTAGKFTAPATMTASSVLLTAGTFTAGANLNNSGNWTNNGATFTNSSGTVTLTGATPTIGGTSANTFYNLTAITADQVIVFPQASTTTISGTLKLEGASGHNILLKSDEAGSDGSKAHRARVDIAAVLDNHSNGYFQYVTPYDNDASNGAAQPIQQQNCVDGGNNLGWLFNVLPVASSVLIDGVATDVILTEGTTHNVVCAGTVTDLNGYADITSVTAKLYRSGVGAGAGDNNANHYTLTGDSNCIPSGGSENTETYTCTFPVYFYADPTDDTSSYPTENWVCQMTPTDTVGAGTADTDTIEMDSLTAHDVTTSIVYGSLALGADTGTSDTTTTITNTGNRSIDIQVGGYGSVSDDGKALVCAIGSVTVTNERYSTTEGVSYTSKTTLPSDASPNTVTVDIPQGVSSTGVIYWGMGLPSSGVGSSCAGKVVFTAVNH